MLRAQRLQVLQIHICDLEMFFQASNGLKPFTKHYHFLDSGVPDIVPKLFEINMSSGTFANFEDVNI